jgi:hypothetical protein
MLLTSKPMADKQVNFHTKVLRDSLAKAQAYSNAALYGGVLILG